MSEDGRTKFSIVMDQDCMECLEAVIEYEKALAKDAGKDVLSVNGSSCIRQLVRTRAMEIEEIRKRTNQAQSEA